MSSKYERDYIAKHKQIRNKLMDLARENGRQCFAIAEMASALGMDQRTVKAHLKLMEVDSVGVFTDSSEKYFCTKEGIAILANMLELIDTEADKKVNTILLKKEV